MQIAAHVSSWTDAADEARSRYRKEYSRVEDKEGENGKYVAKKKGNQKNQERGKWKRNRSEKIQKLFLSLLIIEKIKTKQSTCRFTTKQQLQIEKLAKKNTTNRRYKQLETQARIWR